MRSFATLPLQIRETLQHPCAPSTLNLREERNCSSRKKGQTRSMQKSGHNGQDEEDVHLSPHAPSAAAPISRCAQCTLSASRTRHHKHTHRTLRTALTSTFLLPTRAGGGCAAPREARARAEKRQLLGPTRTTITTVLALEQGVAC